MTVSRILLTAAVVLTLGALGLGSYFSPPPSNANQADAAPAVAKIGEEVLTAAVDTQATSATPDQRKTSKRRMDELIAMGAVNPDLVDYVHLGESDPRFQERFFVLERQYGSDTDQCTKVQLDEDTHACWNNYRYNPYFTYDLATLQNLADNDATAAAVLALKLEGTDHERSLYYRLLAANLSGKPGPLVHYLRTRSLSLGPSGQEIADVDQSLEQYAVAVLVDEMGYPFMFAPELNRSMRRYGISPDLLEQTEEQSASLMQGIGEQP